MHGQNHIKSLPIFFNSSRTCAKNEKKKFFLSLKKIKIVSFVSLHVSIPLLLAVFQ